MIGIPMLLLSLCLLAGCSHKVILTAETYTLEAGTELPESPETYASFANAELAAEAIVQADQVDTGKVGTYEAAVVLKGKEYPFAVEVVDTRAPEGSLGEWFVLAKEAVKPEAFGWEYTDASEVFTGFRNAELVKSPEELAAVFQEEGVLAEGMTPSELLGFSWNEEEDTWEETDVGKEDLMEAFEPEEDGLYCLELVSVDAYGNASVAKCYVLLDREAPVISGVEDLAMSLKQDSDMDTLMGALDGITVTDNLLGDITDFLEMDFETLEENEKTLRMKVSYASTDLCGNQAVAEQMMEMNVGSMGQWGVDGNAPTTVSPSVAVGYYQDMAQAVLPLVNQVRTENGAGGLVWASDLEEVAQLRAQELSVKYSHERPDGTYFYAINSTAMGENIARGYVNAKSVFDAWMASTQGHREAILDSGYTEIGMACYCDGNSYYWVQIFR